MNDFAVWMFVFPVGIVLGYAFTVALLQYDLTGKFKNWNYKECMECIKSKTKSGVK